MSIRETNDLLEGKRRAESKRVEGKMARVQTTFSKKEKTDSQHHFSQKEKKRKVLPKRR